LLIAVRALVARTAFLCAGVWQADIHESA